MQRGLTAYIDLDALSKNFKLVKSLAKSAKIISVVKADAYGCGATEVSLRLLKEGTDFLAVAFCSEAVALRQAGIKAPILVLFYASPKNAVTHDLIPVVSSLAYARELSKYACSVNAHIQIHVKVDTGMGRMGIVLDEAFEVISDIAKLPNLTISGILSHLSEAESLEKSFSMLQIERFLNLIKRLKSSSTISPNLIHIANSAGIINLPTSHLDAVRPGIMLYGINPVASKNLDLQEVMSLKACIIDIKHLPAGHPISYNRSFVTTKPTKVAILAMGYADGFNRLFSNNASVLIKGKRCQVLGRICMDLTVVDVTEIDDISTDDEVVVMGRQGADFISAGELALRLNTIPYEVLTTFGRFSKRLYVTKSG